METVYVYHLSGSAETLKQKALECLSTPVFFWVADKARIDLGKGWPDDWRDQGAVFNEHGELRWWKRTADYEALLLIEKPVQELVAVEGEWKGNDREIFLQNLNDRRVSPRFTAYPDVGSAGRLKVKEYWRNGMLTLISPRGFLPKED